MTVPSSPSKRLTTTFVCLLAFFTIGVHIQPSGLSRSLAQHIDSTDSSTSFRVVSWNVAFGQGTDASYNFDRTASWLANQNPDLIALCEMPQEKVSTFLSGLTQRTGRTWYTHFVPKYSGTSEGNLIVSKYAFQSANSRYLSYQRSVAQVTVNIGGRNINFFATHLDHTSSSLRYTQVGELTSWASGFAEPRIVAGDFNAGPDTSEVLRMTTSYFDSWVEMMNVGSAIAYPDNPVGMHTRTRRGRIDYVFYSRAASGLRGRVARIPDSRDLNNRNVVVTLGTLDDLGVRPSDHNSIIADFDLDTGTSPTPTPTPIPTPTPTPTPTTPNLQVNSNTGRALAFHSTFFTKEPFSLRTSPRFGVDERTRVMFIASNLVLNPGEPLSVVLVTAVDSRNVVYSLPVEFIGPIPGFTWFSEVIVRLPDDLTLDGNITVRLSLRGISSNSVVTSIRAP